jgi:LPXTG-motif cell wall-anchored protein
VSYVYNSTTKVVTASPDAGFKLANLPAGWVLQDNGKATYQVTLTDPGLCLVHVDVPTPPVASAPTCNVDGALVVSPTNHVLTTVGGAPLTQETTFGPGQYTIAYTPAPGYTFGANAVTSFPRTVLHKTDDCPTGVISPTVTQSVCTGPGTHSNPVVTPGDVEGDHVSYVYDATTKVVTATPDTGFALANLPAGWVAQENRTATYLVTLTDPGACLVTVVSPPKAPPTSVAVAGPRPKVLPNTGVSGNLALLAGGGLALIMAGGLLLRRRDAQI